MNINEILNIKYPIIQGGMAHIATGAFAATVSESGALGTIGSGAMNPAKLEEEIKICKSRTSKPFSVNLFMLNPNIEEMVEIIIRNDVKIVSIGAGYPGKHLEVLRENDVIVLPLISSPTQAKYLDRSDITAFVAEGMEAGGHIGDMPTMVLIPQVKSVATHPVIAAGGIGSAVQMKAAEILGASGVQIGTGFLFTKECPIHENYKEALIRSKASKITTIGHKKGLPIRLLKNNMTREYRKLEGEDSNLEELEKFTVGRLKRAVIEGDIKEGSLMAGYTAGQFDRIVPVKDFIERLMDDYNNY